MTEGFASTIGQLERQQRAIERALVALRDIEGVPATAAQAGADRRLVSRSLAERHLGQACRPLTRWAS